MDLDVVNEPVIVVIFGFHFNEKELERLKVFPAPRFNTRVRPKQVNKLHLIQERVSN